MQENGSGGAGKAPQIPPRTHPIHLRNRLKRLEASLQPETIDYCIDNDGMTNGCRSRKASSVGFVEVDDLMKFQEEYKVRDSSTSLSSSRLYTSLKHLFSIQSTSTPAYQNDNQFLSPKDSHINPMFANHRKSASISSNITLSRSLTHLPFPPKKRKSHLKRVFSCFSFLKHQ